jgi:hypothetical protein
MAMLPAKSDLAHAGIGRKGNFTGGIVRADASKAETDFSATGENTGHRWGGTFSDRSILPIDKRR